MRPNATLSSLALTLLVCASTASYARKGTSAPVVSEARSASPTVRVTHSGSTTYNRQHINEYGFEGGWDTTEEEGGVVMTPVGEGPHVVMVQYGHGVDAGEGWHHVSANGSVLVGEGMLGIYSTARPTGESSSTDGGRSLLWVVPTITTYNWANVISFDTNADEGFTCWVISEQAGCEIGRCSAASGVDCTLSVQVTGGGDPDNYSFECGSGGKGYDLCVSGGTLKVRH